MSCRFANRRVNAVEGRGKQSGHPRQHPCDPLRYETRDKLAIRDQPPPLWRQGSVFFFAVHVHSRKQRSLSVLLLISSDETLFELDNWLQIEQGKGRHISENPSQGCCTVFELRPSIPRSRLHGQNLFGNAGKPS